ncbi:MAG: hypothetical protein KAT05_02035 [Spirochaetes bacterium]|nr:hypothetical protein [Spirochaetota bacterium]
MKYKIFLTLIIIIFSVFPSSSFEFHNPFWDNGIRYKKFDRINSFLLTKPQFIANFSLPIDYANGIYFGIFYQIDGQVRLSKLFNFKNTIKLGVNTPSINSISFSWLSYPIPYLCIFTNYKFRDFSQYYITEHNLSFVIIGLFDFKLMPKWIEIELLSGINLRFIDLDIRENRAIYKQDWLLEIFMLWQFKILFHPAFVYSIGISIGNYDEFVVYTANYWQVELYNYFHIIKGFSLFLNAGFSYVGSLPMAGNINRAWGEIGVRYEFKDF